MSASPKTQRPRLLRKGGPAVTSTCTSGGSSMERHEISGSCRQTAVEIVLASLANDSFFVNAMSLSVSREGRMEGLGVLASARSN